MSRCIPAPGCSRNSLVLNNNMRRQTNAVTIMMANFMLMLDLSLSLLSPFPSSSFFPFLLPLPPCPPSPSPLCLLLSPTPSLPLTLNAWLLKATVTGYTSTARFPPFPKTEKREGDVSGKEAQPLPAVTTPCCSDPSGLRSGCQDVPALVRVRYRLLNNANTEASG